MCVFDFHELSTNDGAVNNVLMKLGLIKEPLLFLGDQKYFWWITTFANIWKETGWNSIIYIAAIAGIDQSLYEAAELDGAGRFGKMCMSHFQESSPPLSYC